MKRLYSAFMGFISLCCALAMILSFDAYAFAAGGSGPSATDLDAIRSDIKYPNYQWMYLDEYISAEVTAKSAYCFKDPDNDIWRDGNVFIVYRGTEVTIHAKSEGYACVILTGTNDAGWINEAYLSEKYSYTTNPSQQRQVSIGAPGPKDLQGCNEQVQYPKAGNWLQNYETKYLKTKYGKCAYLRYRPSSDSDYYDYVYERAKVTVLARENGFSLVRSNEGMAGWVTSSLLYDSYPGTVPERQQSTDNAASSQSIFYDVNLRDGEYNCLIDWTLNPMLADYNLSFSIDGVTYTCPMNRQIMVTVYGWGQDGYHEIEYTCAELDTDRYDNHYDFKPGNSSEATIIIENGIIVSLSIHYVE